MLSNLYLWRIGNNSSEFVRGYSAVVICFQICIFDVSETMVDSRDVSGVMLWFAFKFVSLTYRKQYSGNYWHIGVCCDLLSNLYLWRIENNYYRIFYYTVAVVICFQICIFDVSKTIARLKGWELLKLWFAFKFVSLTYRKQLL